MCPFSPNPASATPAPASATTEQRIVQLGLELGWAAVGIADIALEREAEGYQAWIAAGHHGEMEYMARHGSLRWQPDDLQPGTQSVICVALDYWPQRAAGAEPDKSQAGATKDPNSGSKSGGSGQEPLPKGPPRIVYWSEN